MKKRVLIIGFGSIGKRHALVLKKFKSVGEIFILTRQKIVHFKSIRDLKEINFIDPDYILICSKTSDHYEHLKYIERHFKNKIVLVEKPLFNKSKNLTIKNNKVFVGYNLRYHPIIRFLKNKIKKKKIFSIYIFCGSYLPNWKKNQNYQFSYSSQKKLGGGALLDLSHEIDYLQWIFGKIKKIDYVNIKKISNLKIDSDDYVNLIGKIKNINFSINLNYFTKRSIRTIVVDGKNFSLQADLIKNKIYFHENGKKKNIKFNIHRNFTYKLQHSYLLEENYKISCSFKNGKNILSFIDKMRNLNN